MDKIEGSLNENIGKAKAAVGNAVNNDDLVLQGKAQQAKGLAQQVVGEVKDKATEKAAEVKSAVQDHSK